MNAILLNLVRDVKERPGVNLTVAGSWECCKGPQKRSWSSQSTGKSHGEGAG